jgi:hypothetical protein
MREDHEIGPPLEPADERELAGNDAFLASCQAALDDISITKGWTLGPQRLTHSDRWGPVWRVDFEFPDTSLKPLINRIICWQTEKGDIALTFAIGQFVSPLDLSTDGNQST